jgi:DNA-binding MarR family transcriptional regulator
MLFAASVPPLAPGSSVLIGSSAMTEQFGAIPVRAFGDTRLSAVDFRVMGAIAYFDRLGRNGAGCFVDPRKLAELASVDYTHVNRHTRRLQDFGYLEIERSATDRRRRVYSLIYNEDRAAVANSSDNPARADTASPLDECGSENVANSGYIPPEKVATPNSQAVDPVAKSRPKRLSEAYLKDPAKPRCTRAPNPGHRVQGLNTGDHKDARQADRGGGISRAQGPFMLPINWANQPQRNQPRAPDWNGWAAWLQREQGMTKEEAWAWLMARLERIETERGVDSIEAGEILDRELKRRRKVAA